MSPLLRDVKGTIERLPLIFFMAMSETRARYKRSILGPLWLTLGAAFGVAGLGVVWSTLLHQSVKDFVPSLTVGLLLWQFMANSIVESAGVFSRQAQLIRNLPLPYLIYPTQLLLRQLITLAHNLIVLIVVFIIYPPGHLDIAWMSVVGFILVVINLGWIILMLGIVGCRFRDLEQMIPVVMPILFFITPVLYNSVNLDAARFLIWLNPLAYFVTVVRDPIFGRVPEFWNYAVVGGMAVLGWIFALLIFNLRRSRIAFWV